MKSLLKLWSIAIVLSASTVAMAEDRAALPAKDSINEPTCSASVRNCLAVADADRAECFHEAATTTACTGNELGNLAFQRWALAPSTPGDSEQAKGLLGPQLVDKECLVNFDNQLSSMLILGNPTSDALTVLRKKLTSCRREATDDMFRP